MEESKENRIGDMKVKLCIILIMVVILALIYFHITTPRELPARYTQAELDRIIAELDRRDADDCVLTRTDAGYQCKEIHTGRVFRIAEREALTK